MTSSNKTKPTATIYNNQIINFLISACFNFVSLVVFVNTFKLKCLWSVLWKCSVNSAKL